jgi:NAD(P)-dependent dehydrogenase (short-subunit alcohol dehydrogenase family)
MTKQVVVTGAREGLGRSIVETLVGRGWTVWATDINPDGLDVGGAQHTARMDVSDPDSVREVMARVHATGGIDALVNNAGIYPLMRWDEHDPATMHRVFDVNVVGSLLCTQEAAKSMIERGTGGSIVNIVSLVFYKGFGTALAYAASKGALIALTRSFARALGEHEIRINALAPGFMETPGNERGVAAGLVSPERFRTGRDPERQLPGICRTEDVAPAVAMLLGDDAREVTGQVLAADGGTYFI